MNWMGFGRKRSWHESKYYPDIYLERLRKSRKTSVVIADVPAEIRIEHL
jgi:hypothetical protein